METELVLASEVGPRHAFAEIHVDRLASVHGEAKLSPGCSIGPFAVVEQHVEIGPSCVLHAHAVVRSHTKMGGRNTVHSFACIGGPPQDLRHRGEPTVLVIGDGNDFREHVTVNRGTLHGGGRTVIGDCNLLMAYVHVAHDCLIGSRVIMANGATLAGHVEVGDHAVFGGLSAVGSFVRIGESAMIAAGSFVERDAPPFCIVEGNRAKLRGTNRVGLERRGISPRARAEIKLIAKALMGRDSLETIAQGSFLDVQTEEGRRMREFLALSRRGLAR
ncbi:MAG: acyl-ACP--UDP-N-acetylglucosamine O-acyltransferase [Myxococcota bacterium]|jgi:UDP-N-acetylglucosamine acyltransferase|nr:acyl-ACP--UDP-N-acetylglucosamine O-acyltransferase [Myxococcota bacterium]